MALANLRSAVRLLQTNPGFTLVAVATLAVGIGANAATFSIFNAIALRPLPYPDSQDLVWVNAIPPGAGEETVPVSMPEYLDWRSQATSFSSMSAYRDSRFYLTGGDQLERVSGAVVSPDLFKTLRVLPRQGRVFRPEEGAAGSGRVALVGYNLWRGRFGADPGLVGSKIEVNGEPCLVVGIMPQRFRFPEYAELWLPLVLDPAAEPRDQGTLSVVARRGPGKDLPSVRAEMQGIGERLAQAYPSVGKRGALVVPLRSYYVGDTALAALVFLLATAMVLLIACSNLASLLLARASTRRKELALRGALGAGRRHLLGQLLTESILLAVLGALPGLLLARLGLAALVRFIPIDLPFWADFGLDWRVVLFVGGVAVLTGIAFGLAPALHAMRIDLNEALRVGAASQDAASRRWLKQGLVVAEVAVAMAVLVAAGLMVRGFLDLQRVDAGFRSAGVLSARVSPLQSPVEAKYQDPQEQRELQRRVLARLGQLGKAERMALASALPLRVGTDQEFTIEGAAATRAEDVPSALLESVGPGYFETLGIPVRAGRAFDERDHERSPQVAVVNETLARRYWPGEPAVGRRLKLARWDQISPWIEVVGVAGDVRQRGLGRSVRPAIYVPITQQPRATFYVFLKTTGDPLTLAAPLRDAVREVEPGLPVDAVESLQQVVTKSLWQPAVYSWLLSVFAGIALLLAILGVYGLVEYSVSRRTHEIGIRIALGATNGAVLRLVVGQTVIKVLIGLLLGLAGAFVLSGLLGSALVGFSPFVPWLPAVLALSFLAVAVAASYLPVRRAMHMPPTLALKTE